MRRIILDRTPRFIGELAEVDFESVRGCAKHVDVGPGAKDSWFETRQYDCTDFRMFEPNPLNSIRQLDIDAKIIGVELEFVAFIQSLVFLDIHGKCGDRTLNLEFPMVVLFR
jgi:hypothetical protein